MGRRHDPQQRCSLSPNLNGRTASPHDSQVTNPYIPGSQRKDRHAHTTQHKQPTRQRQRLETKKTPFKRFNPPSLPPPLRPRSTATHEHVVVQHHRRMFLRRHRFRLLYSDAFRCDKPSRVQTNVRLPKETSTTPGWDSRGGCGCIYTMRSPQYIFHNHTTTRVNVLCPGVDFDCIVQASLGR